MLLYGIPAHLHIQLYSVSSDHSRLVAEPYLEGAREVGLAMTYDDACESVYGEPYGTGAGARSGRVMPPGGGEGLSHVWSVLRCSRTFSFLFLFIFFVGPWPPFHQKKRTHFSECTTHFSLCCWGAQTLVKPTGGSERASERLLFLMFFFNVVL